MRRAFSRYTLSITSRGRASPRNGASNSSERSFAAAGEEAPVGEPALVRFGREFGIGLAVAAAEVGAVEDAVLELDEEAADLVVVAARLELQVRQARGEVDARIRVAAQEAAMRSTSHSSEARWTPTKARLRCLSSMRSRAAICSS